MTATPPHDMNDDDIQITTGVRPNCPGFIKAANPRITSCLRCGRPADMHKAKP